jgi:hypothetical protein
MSDRIPCRVSADLRKHLREQEHKEQFAREFDPADPDLMADLFGSLSEPLSNLLMRLEAVEKTDQSFGADKALAFNFLLPALYKLREACKERFNEL